MFARRNIVHQRQNGAHHGLAARLAPTASNLTMGNSASAPSPSPSPSSADPTSSDPALTPAAPSSKTPDPSSSPSSAAASPPSASASNSAASSAASSASASSSPSAAHTVSSASPTSVVAAPVTTAHAPAVVSQDASTLAFTPTTSLSPSPTSTTPASGGTSTALIVGGVAGGIAGLALLAFLLTWCMRRQRNHDDDAFDADAFKRQSAILVDDPIEPLRSYNRPQTMIENHNASPALAAQAGYGGHNFYGNYDGYSQQPPPEMVQPPVSLPQAYGAAPMGYAAYNNPSQQQLSRQPSSAAFLARQQSSAAGYAPPPAPPSPFDSNTHYIDLNRSSVSPYQAAQYADISRHLGTSDPNGLARESLALPDDPLPSPFDDPVQPSGTNATSHVDVDPFHAPLVTTASTRQFHGNAAEPQRVTLYQEDDAYGGI